MLDVPPNYMQDYDSNIRYRGVASKGYTSNLTVSQDKEARSHIDVSQDNQYL